MLLYTLKRLLMMAPIILIVAFLVFTIMNLTPGNPARIILGPSASPEAIDKLNTELGYDRPFFVRFGHYVFDVVTRFDFGNAYRTREPVVDELVKRVPVSLRVAFNGILFATLVGIPIGIVSAVKQYSAIDSVARVLGILLASIPAFWLGLMLIMLFSLKLGLLPSSGLADWKSFVLPMIALGLPASGSQLRFTRSAMLETIRQDYVRTARAKGVPEHTVIFGHALKNALLPIITVIGSSFGGLLGGAVLTESIFSLPGLGTMIVSGIRTKDIPIVMGGTLFFAVMFGIIMLIVDLLYAFVDPRIKAKYSR